MATPDDFLPPYQFFESHEGSVAAPPKPVLDAAATLEDRDDALVRALLTLRELPARIAGALGLPGALKDEPRFGIKNFTLLARDETSLISWSRRPFLATKLRPVADRRRARVSGLRARRRRPPSDELLRQPRRRGRRPAYHANAGILPGPGQSGGVHALLAADPRCQRIDPPANAGGDPPQGRSRGGAIVLSRDLSRWAAPVSTPRRFCEISRRLN